MSYVSDGDSIYSTDRHREIVLAARAAVTWLTDVRVTVFNMEWLGDWC